MSSAERRKQEREELRRLILDTAQELLATDGYEKVSMRRIAEKVNYSPTALYLYFKDRGEMMDALAAEAFALLADTLESIQGGDPAERLRRIGHAYVEFALANRPVYALMLQTSASPQDRYGEHATRRTHTLRAFGILADTVRQIAGSGDAEFAEGSDSVTVAATVFWAHIHGAVALVLGGHSRVFAGMEAQVCRQAVETAVAGLLAELPRKS